MRTLLGAEVKARTSVAAHDFSSDQSQLVEEMRCSEVVAVREPPLCLCFLCMQWGFSGCGSAAYEEPSEALTASDGCHSGGSVGARSCCACGHIASSIKKLWR